MDQVLSKLRIFATYVEANLREAVEEAKKARGVAAAPWVLQPHSIVCLLMVALTAGVCRRNSRVTRWRKRSPTCTCRSERIQRVRLTPARRPLPRPHDNT